VTATVDQAFRDLLLLENRPIHDIFGEVLAKRTKQRESDCFIFRLLALGQIHELDDLKRDCGIYIRELGLKEAQQKCRDEIIGAVRLPSGDFNARCGDFWAEMAAVRVLSDDHFHRFKPIARKQQRTSDYLANVESVPAYVEVKNLHANEIILDVFVREIREAHGRQPSSYAFHLRVDYPYDHRPTGEQERIIRDFIQRIEGRQPPFRAALDLVNFQATIDVTAGDGNAHLCRAVGGDYPEPVNEEWLLKKVRNKAEEALGQMPADDHVRALVINVDSTTAMLSSDFFEKAQQEIRDVFVGSVRPYVLHFRHVIPVTR
jgi:hypothetical protein